MADDVNSGVTPDNAPQPSAQKPGDTLSAEPSNAELYKTIQSLQNSVARLTRINGKPTKNADNSTEPATVKASKLDTEIDERVKRIEEREARVRQQSAKNSINDAFTRAGISADYLDDARRRFADEHTISYDDDGNPLVRLSEIDGDIPVDKAIAQLVKEKKYDRFRPAVQTPKIGPNGKPVAAKRQMTHQQYSESYARGERFKLSEIELTD